MELPGYAAAYGPLRKSIRAIVSGATKFQCGEAPELLFPINAEISKSSS